MTRNLNEPVAGPRHDEHVEELLRRPGVRVERIVSRGHVSPPGSWYDQEEDEWVLLVAGAARLVFEDRDEAVDLAPGDWLEIPARTRHRVEWTDPAADTVWLAVFTPPPAVADRIPPPTDRLTFERLDESHLDFVATMLGDPEVMRYYPATLDRAGSARWIERQRERYGRDGHGLWLLRDRVSGTPIGQAGLIRQRVEGVPVDEIGYLVHRPFWRRGYASEAAAAIRDWAFGTLGLPRVISLIRPENVPSRGVARRNGMTEAGETMHAGLRHLVFERKRPTSGSRAP